MARNALVIVAAVVASTTASNPAVAQFNGKYHVVGATHRYQAGASSQLGRANERLRTAGPSNKSSASSQTGQGYRVKVKFPTLPRGKTQSVTSR